MENERDLFDYLDLFGGLLIPILTFLFGYKISTWIENKKAKRDFESYRNYFELYWEEQLIKVAKQIEYMSELSDRLSKHKSFEGVKFTNQLHPFFLYESIDKQKLVDSYRAIGKEQMVIKRMGFIEFLKHTREDYLNACEKFQTKNNELGDEWVLTMKSFTTTHMNIMSQSSEFIRSGAAPEIININGLLNQESREPSHLIDSMIIPMKDYLVERYRNNPSNPYANAFLPILMQLQHVFSSNKTLCTNYSTGFKNSAEKLELALNKIQEFEE